LSAVSSSTTPHIWWSVTTNTASYDALERRGLWINLGLYGLPLILSIAVALIRPRWWQRTLLVAAFLPLPLLAASSGRTIALIVVGAVLLPICWLGKETARYCVPHADRATHWALGTALGIGLLGVIGFVAGLLGLLRPVILWPLLLLIFVGLLASAARARLGADFVAAMRALRQPLALTPLRVILAGLLVATAWVMILGALTPETASDAARQRTPTAVDFAATHSLRVTNPDLDVASLPALGEALYATLLAIGPLATVKLLALATSGACILLVRQLARQLDGRRTGELAVFSFATMPLVIWLSQTAYLDLFTCLATLAAALFLLTPPIPTRAAGIAFGLCCGWGVAVKLHFAYIAIGLGLTLVLLALRPPGQPIVRARRAALLASSAIAAATLVALPPLVRSAILRGQIPGLTLASQSLVGGNPAVLGDLVGFGYGHGLAQLMLLPLNLMVNSLAFEWVPTPWGPFDGLLGYLPISLLPLLLIMRPRYQTVALWMGAAVATLFWFYSAQYLRYGLPIVALLCPLGAAAFESVRRNVTSGALRRTLVTLVLILAVAGAAVQARVPTYALDFVLGRQTTAEYVDRYVFCCAGTTILQLLDAQPDAARAYALYDPPRLYARTPIGRALTGPNGVPPDLRDPAAVLAALDAGGYTHLLISRRYLPSDWAQSQLMDETFLRRYTTLVGNGPNTYLYRLSPPNERAVAVAWTTGPELLANGDFSARDPAGNPRDWTMTTPKSAFQGANVATLPASGSALLIERENGWIATVPVISERRYLLDTASRSAAAVADTGGLTLRLDWHDANGQIVSSDVSSVPTDATQYHRFSLVASAPAGATTVTVALVAQNSAIWVDTASLRETVGGVDAGIGP